ncbi:MAG: LacI family DNA-binding transcriptional regulator [Paracoccaceae bacterium]|nr:LacI family DNA-binding transcriptional regulator [Paracoccaceae bacterium]
MNRAVPSRKRATMKDVADEAGVNRSTVARVIEQPELVAKKTRLKVEGAINKLDYMPNRLASALRGKRSRIVTLLAPPRLAAVYGAIVTELTKKLSEEGLIVNLFPISRDAKANTSIIREALGWSPAVLVNIGMPLAENAIDIIKASNIPVVHLFDRPIIQFGSCVSYDHKAAALSLVSHLVSRGNRHIGYVHRGGDTTGLCLQRDRFDGFCAAIQNFGGTIIQAENCARTHSVDGQIVGREFNTPAGFASGKSLLSEYKEVSMMDALIFGSEMTAIGAVSACQEKGIIVPQQLSLAIFDGTEMSEVVSPQITCLDYTFNRVAEAGSRRIVEVAKAPETPFANIEVPFSIRIGETT